MSAVSLVTCVQVCCDLSRGGCRAGPQHSGRVLQSSCHALPSRSALACLPMLPCFDDSDAAVVEPSFTMTTTCVAYVGDALMRRTAQMAPRSTSWQCCAMRALTSMQPTSTAGCRTCDGGACLENLSHGQHSGAWSTFCVHTCSTGPCVPLPPFQPPATTSCWPSHATPPPTTPWPQTPPPRPLPPRCCADLARGLPRHRALLKKGPSPPPEACRRCSGT